MSNPNDKQALISEIAMHGYDPKNAETEADYLIRLAKSTHMAGCENCSISDAGTIVAVVSHREIFPIRDCAQCKGSLKNATVTLYVSFLRDGTRCPPELYTDWDSEANFICPHQTPEVVSALISARTFEAAYSFFSQRTKK